MERSFIRDKRNIISMSKDGSKQSFRIFTFLICLDIAFIAIDFTNIFPDDRISHKWIFLINVVGVVLILIVKLLEGVEKRW